MAHTHEHDHSHQATAPGLSQAFWLNLVFSIIELVGGLWTNSTAIVADAFHDFMDAVAIGIAVLLEKVSRRKRSPAFSYGYRRFSLLAALGMSSLLIAGAVWMVVSAIQSFIEPKAVDSIGMLGLAVLGVLINGFAFFRIRRTQAGQDKAAVNYNSRAIMLHLLEDVLGWVAVLIGATIMYFTGWYWIDGLLTLAIAGFIAYNAGTNLIHTMRILLQSVPMNIDTEALAASLGRIEGVADIHDLHVWSLDGSYHVGTLHVVIDEHHTTSEEAVYHDIVQLLQEHHIQHPTIQIESSSRNCMLRDC